MCTAKATGASRSTRQFPKGFYWGSATASYRIEGAWNEDGKCCSKITSPRKF